jgi:ERF superfamily
MTEAKTATLTEALNRVQAELKPIRRNTEGQVGQRKRKYADLAAVTEAVYPLLGKHGLAFSAKPTVKDGQFVLAYRLRHVSGEEDAGDWPLNGGKPQDVGSEITYARRYCLCAITGAAPEGEDDDGQAAQDAPPARQPQRRVVTDDKWLDEIKPLCATFATDDDGRTLWRRVVEKTEAKGCTDEDAKLLKELIQARHQELKPARVKTAHQDPEHQRLVESAEDRAMRKPAERLKAVPDDDPWVGPLPEESSDG